jgi:hypothetical protein
MYIYEGFEWSLELVGTFWALDGRGNVNIPCNKRSSYK